MPISYLDRELEFFCQFMYIAPVFLFKIAGGVIMMSFVHHCFRMVDCYWTIPAICVFRVNLVMKL